jgi:hypothetical protein
MAARPVHAYLLYTENKIGESKSNLKFCIIPHFREGLFTASSITLQLPCFTAHPR